MSDVKNHITIKSELHKLPFGPGRGAWKSVLTYRFAAGLQMLETSSAITGRDRYDDHVERFSDDNGHTWHGERLALPSQRDGDNVARASEVFLDLDNKTQTVLRVYSRSIYQNDSDDCVGLISSLASSHLLVQTSRDGGETFSSPLDLTRKAMGKNTFPHLCGKSECRLQVSCSHLEVLSNGILVIPIYRVALSGGDKASGTRSDRACMLIGRWNIQKTTIEWEFGDIIPFTNSVSGGLNESSIVQLSNGKLLSIAREESSAGIEQSWHKWMSVSGDDGYTWEPARPLLYVDGDSLISPPSCCRLWRHSSGRLYLIGNILLAKCPAIQSRNALRIAEIDETRLKVVKETLTVIDQRKPKESLSLALSNFSVYEDRETTEICVMVPRIFAHQRAGDDAKTDYGDCIGMRYRINVGKHASINE